MSSGRYIYDGKKMKFRKAGSTLSAKAVTVIKYFLVSVSLAVLYYFLFSLIFDTYKERSMKEENRLLSKIYPDMEKKEALLADVLDGLKVRDDNIYQSVFHSLAPSRSRLSSVDLHSIDASLKDEDIVAYSSKTLDIMENSMAVVEANFENVFARCTSEGFVMPPMCLPLKDFTYAMTGASVGDKISPFYKVPVRHTGIDFISPSGTSVYATGDGVVTDVIRSRSGAGNVVEISHEGGYVTRYAHIEDITVPRGRRVKTGELIGHVGISGQTFAPHLHYEVYKGDEVCDPIDYFFGSVTPEEYADMLVMSVTTGQSMD